jgi:hypothetical protein
MRLLPIAALVLVSLTFTVGGVAIVGRADSADQSKTAPTPASATPSAGQPLQTQCAQPERHDVRIPANRYAVPSDTITLNTRGYNYAGPGEIQMDPTGRTEPGQVLPPAPQPAVPPAAPAPAH